MTSTSAAVASPSIVRTVLGDIAPEQLGATNYHEHLFQVSPLLGGDELDSEELSGLEAGRLRGAGIAAMIEATPTGLGRQPEAVARISAATGLHVVHVTGAHHGGHYPESHPIRSLDAAALGQRFLADLNEGFGEDLGAVARDRGPELESVSPVRAGMLKAGIRYWQIGAFERTVIAAVGQAHRATQAAVMVHLDFGSAAHEVADLLEQEGVPRERVVLAHIDRNLDAGLHADLLSSGLSLGYDGPARHREAPDEAIIACLERVIASVGERGILLGGDVARRSRYLAYGGMPGLEYLPLRFLPRLEAAIGVNRTQHILRDNPARLLAFPASSPAHG